MKKADVEFHSSMPAVNVKCSLSSDNFTDAKIRPPAEAVVGDRVDEFVEWWHQQDDHYPEQPGFYKNSALDDLINTWWAAAGEAGWEMLQDHAKEAFPDHDVKVWSEGRSGGWCVVDGLDPVRTWDAVMLGKWARFVKWANEVVDDIPYQIVWLIAANVFECVLHDRANDAAAQLPLQLSV